MKVKEMIAILSKFDGDMDVVIADGYNYRFYEGDYEIVEFEGSVDIGVGGCDLQSA